MGVVSSDENTSAERLEYLITVGAVQFQPLLPDSEFVLKLYDLSANAYDSRNLITPINAKGQREETRDASAELNSIRNQLRDIFERETSTADTEISKLMRRSTSLNNAMQSLKRKF